ncbi:MAG: bifunctional DNA-binding transcriptional regulator/O6-methylguanine-DNA methyltransferase Ada [Burkholderiales bacterium]|nr:MAG: bifunctional DNA-binding transcriptional regulator/O6-methylguanine-DNA methyltransferase Ada [Burkholderiales bacterium]
MGRASVNQTELVVAVCRHIEHADAEPTLEELALLAGVSSFYLQRLFKAQTGVTPKAYAQAHRARRVREALASEEASVTAAFYDAGYSSSGRFYEQADAVLGMTPRDFKAGGAGHDIRFAVGQCTLGAVLVAASERGVCAILLGDEPELLVKDLQDRFKTARLIGADQYFEQWVAQVVGFIESPHLGLNLPLDIRGTAFQQRVWQALRRVPAGQTVSYAELAERIGAPRAVRAVAGACAANPLAVAIPCHRVVRHDGAISGYRWGVERKRNLLCREAAERDKVIG